MVSKAVSRYFRRIGKKGGSKSRRTLTTEQAQEMVKAREAKRAERMKREEATTGPSAAPD